MKKPPPEQDQDLRAAYRDSVGRQRDTDRRSCPEPEKILGLVEGTGSEEGRLSILDHVMQCEDCRQEFDMLRTLHEARPRRRAGIPSWMSLAASVVLLCGIGYGAWTLGGRGSQSPLRGPGAGIALLSPEEGSVQDDTLTFMWASQPGAIGYTLEILASDGRSVFTRQTGDTVVTLDRSDLPDGSGELKWWVRARGPDGVERGSELRPLLLPQRTPPSDLP